MSVSCKIYLRNRHARRTDFNCIPSTWEGTISRKLNLLPNKEIKIGRLGKIEICQLQRNGSASILCALDYS